MSTASGHCCLCFPYLLYHQVFYIYWVMPIDVQTYFKKGKENPLVPVSFSALLQKAEFLKGGLFLLSSFPFHSFFRSALRLCLSLCERMDCCPPGSSVHGISQARILEWVAISSSRGSSRPRDWTDIWVTCIGRQILYDWGPGEAVLSWTHSKTYLAARCLPHC